MDILEILGRIGFDWQVALANLVNFLIIFVLLKYFAFKPIAKIIRERKEKIQKGLDDAQQAQSDMLRAQEQSEKITQNARQEANTIIAGAQERVDALLTNAQHEAQEQVQKLINEAHVKIEKDRARMQQEFRGQAAGLIVESVEKIMRSDMSEKDHEKLMVRALDMMRSE